jgi:hypothetical protein
VDGEESEPEISVWFCRPVANFGCEQAAAGWLPCWQIRGVAPVPRSPMNDPILQWKMASSVLCAGFNSPGWNLV